VDYIFSYSNLAIDVLGILIERVSGERFESYVTQHILKPLGMETSSVRLDETTRERLSKGYHLGKSVWEPMLRDVPAGGIHSTVLDMARFIGMVNGQGTFESVSVLRAETLAQMLTPQNAGDPLDFNLAIGLNWMLSRPALEYAGRVCWHDGSSQYFNTQLVILPKQQLGVVVLCNSDTGAAATATIADEALKLALKVIKGIEPPVVLPANLQTSQVKLDEYAGDYPTVSLGLIRLSVTPKTAVLNLKGLLAKLVPQQDGWCRLRPTLLGVMPVPMKQLDDIRVRFQTIQGQKVMAVEQRGLQVAVAKRHQRQLVPSAWQSSIGKYRNMDANDITIKTMELKCADGWLWIEATAYKLGRIKIFLQPLTDGQALTLGLGRMANETVFLKDRRLELWGG
jgi:hypothetical protein